MIHVIREKATKEQIKEMLEILGSYVKVAVDIKREILSGGGELHADCETMLLQDGSKQKDVWGADWVPKTGEIRLAALINIRPKQNNRSMEIQDVQISTKVRGVIKKRLKAK